MNPVRITILTALALVAFASNSLLCRLALGERMIDAASFSTIRMAAGAAALVVVVALANRGKTTVTGGWASAFLLFLYAAPFSFAYTSLSAGTGALILFAAVQATMMGAALRSGERPGILEWLGFTGALVGLAYLLSPGLQTPSPVGAGLMALAGIAWGMYSLRGRTSNDPTLETAGNFIRSVPFVLIVSILATRSFSITANGALLAVVSGAIASGVGYTIWYSALRGLTSARAATVQLLVPVLAAVGGIVFLAEELTWRMAASTILIIGGVSLALTRRQRRVQPK